MENIDAFVFDMDDTLYPKHLGICQNGWDKFAGVFSSDKKYEFGIGHLTFADFEKHGDKVLRDQKDFDWDAFLEYICFQDVSSIQYNPELKDILSTIKQRKIIFTNADYRHMDRVLDRLELSTNFEKFTCFDSNFHFKPEPEAFEVFLNKMKLDAKRCVFFEDNLKNIEMAKQYGMTTVFVAEEPQFQPSFCDYQVQTITEGLRLFL